MSKSVVILFDIDGTMLLTGGAGQQAMADVIAGKEGSTEWREGVTFAGRTDRGILADLFRLYGIEATPAHYEEAMEAFLPVLEKYLPLHDGVLLPAVTETIEALRTQPQVSLGLLTGNLRRAARKKLEYFQLAEYFLRDGSLVGGFGDFHPDRDDVARMALAEVRQHLNPEVAPEDVWVIGDTPNDIRCARAIGARVVAVATGSYSSRELTRHGPDLVCEDLTQATSWWTRLQDDYGVDPGSGSGNGID